ncbi:hypothetical protein C8R45DRAFT_511193 [Mycena sanguinolenta]|nr:hypothetical protein C8R45DRAFT_511193 [Mycena sanguinolenta]
MRYIQQHGETGLQILRQVAAGSAFHDSAERYPQPRCHPETQKRILDSLWNWSSQTDLSSTVLWLRGPAGAGKTAIAQSFCQNLEAEHRLAASFFFQQGHSSRGAATKLFPTIAYQLALSKNPFDLCQVISRTVGDDPSILDRSLARQVHRLIVDPCRQTFIVNLCRRIFPKHPVVIVIDGLDECDNQNVQQEILRSIGNAIRDEYLPLRILIASRPEPYIHKIFTGPSLTRCHGSLNIQQSFEDVRQYLVDEFTRIHTEHHETMATVPRPWPPVPVIQKLVNKSSGYFLYASTVIKYIDDEYFRPTERLEIIMGPTVPDSKSPFSALDQLYTQILLHVDHTIRPSLLRILTFYATQWSLQACHVEQLLKLQRGDVRLTLRGLHSLFNIDGDNVTVHHASFLDFLDNPARSGIFHAGSLQQRIDFACDILKAFSYKYEDTSVNRTGPVALHPRTQIHHFVSAISESTTFVSGRFFES